VAQPQVGTAQLTATPAISSRSVLPPATPTNVPPAQCRFGNDVVSVPLRNVISPPPSPAVVPTQYQPNSAWTIFATGEVTPGVFVDALLPSTTFVAGAVITSEIDVRNTTTAGIALLDYAGIEADNSQNPRNGAPQQDPRAYPELSRTGPGPRYFVVPSGQKWAFRNAVQLPFDASQNVHLHVLLQVGPEPTANATNVPFRAEFADIGLHLLEAGQAQQLHLDLIADRQQWCLRATNGDGSPPNGPLSAFATTRSANGSTSIGGVPGGNANTWAARFDLSPVQPTFPIEVTVWVGGEKYVTAQAHATIQP
jgi:hypothetical protein